MKRYEYGDPSADIVLIQMVDDHDLEMMEKEVAYIRERTARRFHLIAVQVGVWNRDLSPWEAPAVFGNEAFGDGAAATLSEIEKLCTDRGKTYYIGGYSLAGLFALWAACQTDLFRGVAAASPSVWFPDFVEYIKGHSLRAERVYLSLGDREEKTRNPVMATVGDKMREIYAWLREQGCDCILEWNQGNHFREADLRTAKAFAWVMEGKHTIVK